MTLGDLLHELRTNIVHDVSHQISGPSDQLWSDKTLVRYINEAQRRLARLTGCLRDAKTPGVTTFVTTAVTDNLGYWETTLDKSIISVMSVRMVGDTTDLPRGSHPAFSGYKPPDTYFFDPSTVSTVPPGKPLAYSTDEGLAVADDGDLSTVTLRLFPAVSPQYAGIVGQMRVVRMPLTMFTPRNMNEQCEIPHSFQIAMLDWAGYLALRKPDTDTYNPQAAEALRRQFDMTVEEVKSELRKKEFAPLTYGFGRNGWSWEGNGGW